MLDQGDEFPLPVPRTLRPLPHDLYCIVETWPWWQGSPTELGRLARRLEARFSERFMSFQESRFEDLVKKARRSGDPEPRQLFVFNSHVVSTSRWAGGVRARDLQEEVQARRAQIQTVTIQSSVIDRGWPVDLFDQLALKNPVDQKPLGPGAHFSWEVESPPQRVEIRFQRGFPAVTLRVFAAGPQACTSLYGFMAPHLDAGARRSVCEPELVAGAGAATGLLGADLLLLGGLLSSWQVVVALFSLGAAGWFGGLTLQRWAFPPLELREAWERSRWSTVKARSWELLALALAVAGVVLAVVFAD